MMDISDTITPNSEQLDAIDLITGPRTFVIERVSKGNAEQPVNLHLTGFPRPWRPGKSMRRVLVACWGPDASQYVGRSIRLYCDPEVVFGGLAVGGTRIAALSHVDKPKKVPLLVSRGKSAIFVVQPLADAPAPAQAKVKRYTLAELIADAEQASNNEDLDGTARLAVRDLTGTDLEAAKAAVVARRAELKEPVEDEPTLDGWPAVTEPGA